MATRLADLARSACSTRSGCLIRSAISTCFVSPGAAGGCTRSASRRITKDGVQIGSGLPRSAKVAALAVSLVLSAFLTAVALRLPDQHWLAWISFLPLFVVVRWLRFSAAALAGAFWGGCLYVFATAGVAHEVAHEVGGWVLTIGQSAWLLALLIVIPAVYVGLAARPARAIGFKLLTLALGWTLLEVVLAVAQTHTVGSQLDASQRAGLIPGLPAEAWLGTASAEGLQGQWLGNVPAAGIQNHWLARLLGYIGSAFLVACINASLVGILSGARLCFPHLSAWGVSPNVVRWSPSRAILPLQTWPLRQANPRAPPVPITAVG